MVVMGLGGLKQPQVGEWLVMVMVVAVLLAAGGEEGGGKVGFCVVARCVYSVVIVSCVIFQSVCVCGRADRLALFLAEGLCLLV